MDTKLSSLPALTTPVDADEVYVNDGGVSKRLTIGNLKSEQVRTNLAEVPVPDAGRVTVFVDSVGALRLRLSDGSVAPVDNTVWPGVWDWTERSAAGAAAWGGVASSSDGLKLVAGVNVGYIYTGAAS